MLCCSAELLLVGAFSLEFVENYLAQTQVVRGNFNVLVALDVFESFLEAEHHRWHNLGFFVGA